MTYSVKRTDAFEESYDHALAYLAKTLASRDAARRLMRELERIVAILEHSPCIKAVSTKPLLESRGLREYYFMNYVVVYKVEADTVTLINLFHQSEDYESPRHWE